MPCLSQGLIGEVLPMKQAANLCSLLSVALLAWETSGTDDIVLVHVEMVILHCQQAE